jgi:elongator complex protein 5
MIAPSVSLLAVYHTDVPLSNITSTRDPYSPAPLTLLKYLATTIYTTHSAHHIFARKAARDRSHAEPLFGLDTSVEGVLQSTGANGKQGIVLELEHRRKSGRGVREWYWMASSSRASTTEQISAAPAKTQITPPEVILLEDHPLYRTPEQKAEAEQDDGTGTTFELGLTDKQKRDREGVVLPYFDAQKGGGDGGRILYDLGSEDDFDEEEDEI